MLGQITSTPGFGAVRAFFTDGGTHSAKTWAEMTADRLIELDPAMPAERARAAIAVKGHVVTALGEAFDKLRASAKRTEHDTLALANGVADELARVTRGTDWQRAMEIPAIRQRIVEEVWRSMNTIVRDERNWKG